MRKTSFNQDVADHICGEIAGGRSLRSICEDDGMPAKSTVFKWLREVDGFSDQYARAKQESADAFAEEMADIADDGTNDWMERLGQDGQPIGWQLNGEHVQRSRLRIDTRKWLASKLKPKKYGEKLELDAKVSVDVSERLRRARERLNARK